MEWNDCISSPLAQADVCRSPAIRKHGEETSADGLQVSTTHGMETPALWCEDKALSRTVTSGGRYTEQGITLVP